MSKNINTLHFDEHMLEWRIFIRSSRPHGCHKACSGPITCVKSIPLQTKFDLISFEELIGSVLYAN
jgi:hypothetical protein